MKTFVPAALLCSLLLLTARFATGQIAPAAVVFTEGAPGEHYIFRSQGTFLYGLAFGYLNYNTGELGSILTSVQSNGTFSGISAATGRSVSGTITDSTVSFTYNGVTVSAPKSSSYGSTSTFAGVWNGTIVDPISGGDSATAVITSQGQVFVTFVQDFVLNEGFGTISASGTFFVPLLDGRTISGLFSTSLGFFIGSLVISSGTIDTVSLLRAVPARLANISTRGFVGAGELVLIGGFIVTDGGKTVLMNAKWPSVAAAGVASPVQATQISL